MKVNIMAAAQLHKSVRDRGNQNAWVLILVLLALQNGCGGSFSGTNAGDILERSTTDPVAISFLDGEQSQAFPVGAVVSIQGILPASRFSALFLEEAGTFDVDRFIITASEDLGDPDANGFSEGDSLTEFLVQNDMLRGALEEEDRIEFSLDLDTFEPILFPVGRLLINFVLLDNDDQEESHVLNLELLATDRPSLSIILERPPIDGLPTGLELPLDETGTFLAGGTRPFALILRAFPRDDSQVGFDFESNPISIRCDQNLGDPQSGGIPAGTDFGSRLGENIEVEIDPDTGVLITGIHFESGSSILPDPGLYTFTGSVIDQEGTRSFEQSEEFIVQEPLFLEPDVLNIFRPNCAVTGCHDPITRSQGLDLSSILGVVETAIEVPANQPEKGSCAPCRIEPYAPFESYLFHKIAGTHTEDCVLGRGRQMPQFGDPLPEEDLDVIRRWILQGAFP